jgi:hypothetical protein
MSDLFDALKNLKTTPKKHFVTIDGEKIEVSLETKLKIIQNGEQNYTLKEGKPVLKEIKTQRNSFAEIDQFIGDPFWPKEKFIWKK